MSDFLLENLFWLIAALLFNHGGKSPKRLGGHGRFNRRGFGAWWLRR